MGVCCVSFAGVKCKVMIICTLVFVYSLRINWLQVNDVVAKGAYSWIHVLQWGIHKLKGENLKVTLSKLAVDATVYHSWMQITKSA